MLFNVQFTQKCTFGANSILKSTKYVRVQCQQTASIKISLNNECPHNERELSSHFRLIEIQIRTAHYEYRKKRCPFLEYECELTEWIFAQMEIYY